MEHSPWVKKYRPTDFNDLVLPDDVAIPQLESFYDNGFVKGNIICYGATGLGKTSLNEVLIDRIVKDPNDIFILGNTVEEVKKLQRWLNQGAVGSKQKIVKIEEMDMMSKNAQLMLKDGLMEKYTHSTTFLATTNGIVKIDDAVFSRFNIKLEFKYLPPEDVINRLAFILKAEKIKYDSNELTAYVKANPQLGMRDMVSYIEAASSSGTFIDKYSPKKVIKPRTSLISPKIKISLEEAVTTNMKQFKGLLPQLKGASQIVLPKIKTPPICPPKTRPQPTVPSTSTRMLNKKQVLEFFGMAANNPKRFEILDQLTEHPNPLHPNNIYREDEVADLINRLFPRGQ